MREIRRLASNWSINVIAILSVVPAIMGMPIPEAQGEWSVLRMNVLEPLAESWGGGFVGDAEYPTSIWRIKDTQIEWIASHTSRKTYPRLTAGPNANLQPDPKGICFTDPDGVVYRGTYSMKDGVLKLSLLGTVPIPGMKDTVGTHRIEYELIRPKPPKPPKGFVPVKPITIDP